MAPQVMLVGLLVTVPTPAPAAETVGRSVRVKAAVMEVAAVMATTHGAVPRQSPPAQPVNTEPGAGLAVRATAVPLAKLAEQVDPQLIPSGLLVTVPAPAPAAETVSTNVRVKVAVMEVSVVMATTHGAVPAQPPPLQPVNAEPGAGLAVRVTVASLANLAEQVDPQSIPAGALVTVPAPAPAVETVSANVGAKVAMTEASAVMVTTHGVVPLHPPPLQPTNAEPSPGDAVSVTTVPLTKVSVQLVSHEMPAGLLTTVPPPVPVIVTVSAKALLKAAVTAVVASMVTLQVSAPEQPPPLQPVKAEPVWGVAASVTSVPLS